MGFGSTGNFGHTGGDHGLNSVIWFFKDKKMGRYLIVNTDWDSKVSGKDQKAIYDLLDVYFVKLDRLNRHFPIKVQNKLYCSGAFSDIIDIKVIIAI